jgi:hypothetical protein
VTSNSKQINALPLTENYQHFRGVKSPFSMVNNTSYCYVKVKTPCSDFPKLLAESPASSSLNGWQFKHDFSTIIFVLKHHI